MSLGSFLTNRSEIGALYNMGTPLGPDPRFSEDLQAIDDYVRTQARPKTAQFPASLPKVTDYETWRQGLGWYDLNVVPNDTMNSAKAKRDAINVSQQNVLPSNYEVEQGSFVAPPPDTSKQTSGWTKVVIVAVTATLLLTVAARAVTSPFKR